MTCGRGTKTRSREVLQEAKHAGEKCPAREDTRICNADQCPGTLFLYHGNHIFTKYGSSVDCKVGPWRAVGECSATCGGGSRTIKSEIVQEPENGGEKCPALEENGLQY